MEMSGGFTFLLSPQCRRITPWFALYTQKGCLIAVHSTGIFSSFFSAALLAVMSVDLGSEFMKIAIVKVVVFLVFKIYHNYAVKH